MPYQITIGRNEDNKFAIPTDLKISRHHAKLIIHDDGKLELIDTKSVNGTFIYNGQKFVQITPLKPHPVTPDTMIQLGPDTRFHVRRLVPPHIIEKIQGGSGPGGVKGVSPVKKYDISYLRKVHTSYQEKKMELDSKMANVNSIKSMQLIVMTLATGGGALLAEASPIGKENKVLFWIIGIVVAIILMGCLHAYANSRSRAINRAKIDNDNEYQRKYVCPNPGCKFYFGQKIYDNILAEGCCPKCKTKFYEAPKH